MHIIYIYTYNASSYAYSSLVCILPPRRVYARAYYACAYTTRNSLVARIIIINIHSMILRINYESYVCVHFFNKTSRTPTLE